MKLYLVNKNPIITKLVTLSAGKIGLSVEESQELDITNESDILLLDDECYEETLFNSYKASNSSAKSILFFSKSTDRIEGFDEYVQKPFLPTDLLKLLSKLTGIAAENAHEQSDMSDDISQFDDDSLDSFGLDGDIDLSGLDDLGLDDEDSNMNENNTSGVLDEDDVNEIKNLLNDNGDNLGASEDSATNESLDMPSDSDIGLGDVSLDVDSSSTLENPMEGANESFDFEESVAPSDSVSSVSDFNKEQFDEFSADDVSKDSSNEDNEEIDTSKLLSEFDLGEVEEKKDDNDNADDTLDTASLADALDNLSFDDELPQEQPSVDTADSSLTDITDLNIDSMDSVEGLGDSISDLDNADSSMDSTEDSALDDVNLSSESANTEESLTENENLDSLIDEVSTDASDNIADDMELEALDELSKEDELGDILGDSKEQDNTDESTITEDIQDELLEIPQDNEEFSQEDTMQEDMLNDASDELLDTKESQESKPQSSDNEFSALSLEGLSEALGEPITKEPNTAPIVPKDAPNESVNLPTNISATSLDGLIGALQALQTQSLKELLNGATINISIQFPKKDDL